MKALGKFWEKTTIRMDLLRATKENKPSCIALRAGMNFFLWIVIIALIGCLQAQAEALYQGKPESFWLDSLTNANAERFMYEYKTKWLPLGTNAIPLVIKALDKHDVQNAEVIRCNAGFILLNRAAPHTFFSIGTNNPGPHTLAIALSSLTFDRDQTPGGFQHGRDRQQSVPLQPVVHVQVQFGECGFQQGGAVNTWTSR